jgi:hypothetical protein
MSIMKQNRYDGKDYYCDIDNQSIDVFSTHIFDTELHNNDITPMLQGRYSCGYCNFNFPSRNKLFQHLGFMDIDVRSSNVMSIDQDLDMDTLSYITKKIKKYSLRKPRYCFKNMNLKKKKKVLNKYHQLPNSEELANMLNTKIKM